MITQKPIKRHESLVAFSKDHHFGLLLVWKIRQGLQKNIEPERISKYITFFFEKDLVNHFKEEELHLFSKLPENDSLRQRAETEHAAIYAFIATLYLQPANKTLMEQFANTLEKHIRFEERDLFRHLQNSLSADDLSSIEPILTAKESGLDGAWPDEFWTIQHSNYQVQ